MENGLTGLFDGWEETMVWTCLQGHMGQVVAEGGPPPVSALCAVGDFCFLAGFPSRTLAAQADRPILVPRTMDWIPVIRSVWGTRAVPFLRYAIRKEPDVFDRSWLADCAATLPEGVILTSSSGSNRQSVAEHILSFTLALCRRLPTYRDAQRDHRWEDHGAMKTIFGANVLVVGAGNIGATYAAMCRGLGAHTIGLKRTVNGPIAGFDEVFSIDHLDDLLPQADVVVLVLPHSAQTVGLMDEGRLSLMKEDAILISSGRGSVLDQEALARTMKGGRLWGAALDVTEPEPLPTDSPLWDIPNLIITPHVAGGMRLELTRRVCIQMAQDNLRRYLAGEPLKNRVR